MQDELDILREVGSIAAAHGSIALSEILGRRINLFLPSMDMVSLTRVPSKINVERIGIAVIAKLLTGLKGEIIFLLDEQNAFKLIDLSYELRDEDKKIGALTEIGMSLIKEMGSIVIGAYVCALSMILKRIILPPPPTLISGTIEEILRMIFSGYQEEDYAVFIEAVFEEPKEKIKGGFYLVLTPGVASDIKETCKNMLDELEK
ncbi:MAG: chemotaxis protein CheC [Candidatus Omnitrophota bacterium]